MDVKDKSKKKVCLQCLKEQNAENHSKCGQCRSVLPLSLSILILLSLSAVYCNVVCQRAHWKVIILSLLSLSPL